MWRRGFMWGPSNRPPAAATEATVEVDLYKGLKLQTQTGTSTTGSGQASSVGLTYQFNY